MKTAVLKISGKTLPEFLSTDKWTNTIKSLHKNFDGVLVVHGAGKHITEWSEKLGIENKFKDGQRVTTKEQMEVVAAVQAGLVNNQIVAKLNSAGLIASGHSGIDRNSFVADYLDTELGFVGKPKLNGKIDWIMELMNNNIIPVFSSVCRDANGNLMNVNADIFTEVLALAIKVDTVFFVSDVNGVIIDGSVKQILTKNDINEGIIKGDIKDGMIPKLNSCTSLLNEGINKIWIGSQIYNLNNKKKNYNANGTWIISPVKRELELLGTAQYI